MAAMREGGDGLHPPVSPNVVSFNIMIKVSHSWLFQGAKKARKNRDFSCGAEALCKSLLHAKAFYGF